MTTDPPPAVATRPSRPRRPTPVTILAAIQIITSVTYLALAVTLVADPAVRSGFVHALGPGWRGADAWLEALLLFGALGLLELFAAMQLLRLRRVGWTISMLVAGVVLAWQIATYWSTGQVSSLSMLLNVFTVLYLNQRQVQAAFGLAATGSKSDLESERG